jgi:transposase-like protein
VLSDSESKKIKKSSRNRAVVAGTNKQWSDAQKTEAVQSYLLLGNLALTSRILGIPEITLRVWKASTWWGDVANQIKTQERVQLSNKLKKIVDAAVSVTEDRLLNGDYQFDQKSGEVVRKPVNMKDAHKVAVDLMERREILEKSEKEVITEEGVDDKLLKLANKFADMATKRIEQKELEHRTIDVDDVVEIKPD